MYNPRLFALFSLLLASSAPLGCSSSTVTGGGTPDAGGTEPDASGGPADAGMLLEASVGVDASTKPVTPQVSSVMKMSGALHVSWKLNDTGLTGVELWRKKDAGAYAKVVGLPGTATSYHDTGASTAGATYCYQVMTLRGADASEMSNEVCGSP